MNPARPHAYGNIVLDEMSAHLARISPLAALAALHDGVAPRAEHSNGATALAARATKAMRIGCTRGRFGFR